MKLEFSFFLVCRYYMEGAGIIGMLYNEMKRDKNSLKEMTLILKSKAKWTRQINKEAILRMASLMSEAVGRWNLIGNLNV